MVKSMYSGVAGMKAHQSKMDVIGNNIANVNTWGYKSMSASFKESIYQTMSSGSSGSTNNGGLGGTNPAMYGYGSMVSAISSNFTTGTPVPTGNGLDCFIDGTSFFAVGPIYGDGDAKAPGDVSLTRVGDFGVRNGYLVDGNGRYVYGNSMETGGTIYYPQGTTDKVVQENQEIPAAGIPADNNSGIKNGVGTEYKYAAAANKPGRMDVTTIVHERKDLPNPLNDAQGQPLDIATAADADIQAALTLLDSVGPPKVTYTYDTVNKKMMVATEKVTEKNIPLPKSKTEDIAGQKVTTTYTDNGKNDGTCTIQITTVTPPDPDAEYQGPSFDDGRLEFDPETGGYKKGTGVDTLKPLKIPTTCSYYDDAGVLQTEEDIEFSSFTIDKSGMIYGTSTNSQRTYLVGNVALVNVPNPAGMAKSDGPYFQAGGSSGEPVIIETGGTVGSLKSGYLESANVDVANEFSEMITTQRGFQANSKIISVTDEMLQELVNMKR